MVLQFHKPAATIYTWPGVEDTEPSSFLGCILGQGARASDIQFIELAKVSCGTVGGVPFSKGNYHASCAHSMNAPFAAEGGVTLSKKRFLIS